MKGLLGIAAGIDGCLRFSPGLAAGWARSWCLWSVTTW